MTYERAMEILKLTLTRDCNTKEELEARRMAIELLSKQCKTETSEKIFCDEKKKYLIGENNIYGGVQFIYKFDNSFGASVIKHKKSIGYDNDLWELAVLRFDTKHIRGICFDSGITQNVLTNLTNDDVLTYLNKIEKIEYGYKDPKYVPSISLVQLPSLLFFRESTMKSFIEGPVPRHLLGTVGMDMFFNSCVDTFNFKENHIEDFINTINDINNPKYYFQGAKGVK